MAIATSGWMPTMTVRAPRSFVVSARACSVRVANESMTSSAVTSMTTPCERKRPTCSASSSRSCSRSRSVIADWIDAIRTPRCFRMGTGIPDASGRYAVVGVISVRPHHLVPEQTLGLLEASLQVTDGVELAEIDAEGHERLCDVCREPGDDDGCAHQSRRRHRLDQMIRYLRIDGGHACHVHYHHLRPV